MKKICLIFSFLIFSTTAVIACDATLSRDKSYVVITNFAIEKLKINDEKILSGEVLPSIFGEKNQLIIEPKGIGKTQIEINNTVYNIEVSREQKEAWNINGTVIDEIDIPYDIFWGKNEGNGEK